RAGAAHRRDRVRAVPGGVEAEGRALAGAEAAVPGRVPDRHRRAALAGLAAPELADHLAVRERPPHRPAVQAAGAGVRDRDVRPEAARPGAGDGVARAAAAARAA